MLHAAEKNILFMPKTVEKNIGFDTEHGLNNIPTKFSCLIAFFANYSFVYNSLSLYNNI